MPDLVALQALLPQIDSPDVVATKALKIQQLQAAQQARADDVAARAAFSANPTDGAARLNALAGVSPTAYSAEAKRQADLAKSGAETSAKQIETAHKKADLAGQAFGYVRQFPTADNAKSAIGWLGQQGVYSPEEVAQHIATIDANPGNVKTMADQAFAGALSVKEQLPKIETRDLGGQVQTISTNPLTNQTTTLSALAKTQSPDNIATNQRMASEGAADRAARAAEGRANRATQVQLAQDRQDAKSSVEPSLSADTQLRIAKQFLRGDKSGLTNVGRGAQGSANLTAIQNAITEEGKRQGLTGEDIAGRMADFQGQTAGLRTANTISARIENASAEAAELAPLALEASRKVSRSGFLPFGRAQVMFNNNTNDPDMNRFATANIGLATAYAGVLARGGKATESDKAEARHVLLEAKDQGAYEVIVDQVDKEIQAARRAPNRVRDNLRGEVSGKSSDHGAPAPSAGKVVDFGSLK